MVKKRSRKKPMRFCRVRGGNGGIFVAGRTFEEEFMWREGTERREKPPSPPRQITMGRQVRGR